MQRIVNIALLSILTLTVRAQFVHIDSIFYEGNVKTKKYIIRRELSFKENDSLPLLHIQTILLENRSRILNTGLFKEAEINIQDWDILTNRISLHIKVQEAWYIYPFPVFDLADRNFNVWWNEFNGSLKRVNYGIKFSHNNLSGQADALKATFQLGYSPRLDMDYSWPFFGKQRAWRFKTEFLYSQNRESYYKTEFDKLVFFRAETNYALQRLRLVTSLEHRTTLQLFQSISLEYNYNRTADQIRSELNPDFFLGGKLRQDYFALRYRFTYDNRDLKYYPSRGVSAEIVINKEGLANEIDLNTLSASIQMDQYFPWSARHNSGILLKARGSIIRDKIPYYNSKALGFGENYIKGYEYYVLDGMDYLFLKFRQRYIFYDRKFNFRSNKKIGVTAMPMKLSTSLHASTAFVNNIYYTNNNVLTNRWIYSSGFSLECLLSNTSLIQLDCSINHRKELGFYLHFRDQF